MTRQSSLPTRDALTLASKITIAEVVIQEALSRSEKPVILWTGGKDSTVALHMTLQVCRDSSMTAPPALFIDHGQHFQETWDFIDQVAQTWNFPVIIARNEAVLEAVVEDTGMVSLEALDKTNRTEALMAGISTPIFECTITTIAGNHLLKTVPMKRAFRKHSFDSAFIAIRWDENPARATEVFISERKDPRHVRVHPILPFSERNIWDYVQKEDLPINPLYSRGYRSYDGVSDASSLEDVPAWEQDLEGTPERAGRARDKEQYMRRLRELGYM